MDTLPQLATGGSCILILYTSSLKLFVFYVLAIQYIWTYLLLTTM